MEKKQTRKRMKPLAVFAALLVIQLICMIFWGNAKKGYFVDELWSYGLANSYYFPHIYSDNVINQDWVEGSFFSDYLEVQESERFRFGSVLYNMRNDTNPPLYFVALHAVCSLFPETFSKWYGIIINMFSFMLAQLLLYRLSRRVLKNEWLALLPCIVWGFSSASISFVIFIRGYMMSTMFGLLALNLHMDLMEDNKDKKRSVLMWMVVMIVSFLGYMCHYYHFLFAFFLSAFYMLYLLTQKRWKKMVWYASSMGGSLLLTVILFPSAYTSLFGNSSYSQNAINGFSIGGIVRKLQQFVQISTIDLFARSSVLAWIAFVVVVMSCILFIVKLARNKSYREAERINSWFFMICMGTTICYFALAAYVAPYLFNRYVSASYPLIYFLIIWAVYLAWGDSKSMRVKSALVSGVLLTAMAVRSQTNCVDFVYGQAEGNIPAVEKYLDTDVYFITYQYYKLTEKALELRGAERVRVLVPETQRIEEEIARHNPEKEYLLVYVDSGEGLTENILNTVIECSEYSQYRPVEGYEWLYGGVCMPYVVY